MVETLTYGVGSLVLAAVAAVMIWQLRAIRHDAAKNIVELAREHEFDLRLARADALRWVASTTTDPARRAWLYSVAADVATGNIDLVEEDVNA